MGGRGSSSGASRSRVMPYMAQPQQQPQQPPQPQVNDDDNVIRTGMYSQFVNATPDQQADIIEKMIRQQVPDFLADNAFQKLMFGIGRNDKPRIVTDKQLDSMSGPSLYRTVNGVRDTKKGITYPANQIAQQVQAGSVTRVSDTGGSAYGRGIYFADHYYDSKAYGNVTGDVKKTAVMRAKLDPKAKTISYSQASNGVRNEINSNSKLGQALKKCDSKSQESIYALAKGYHVITNRSYYNVISRAGLVMSDKIKSMGSGW